MPSGPAPTEYSRDASAATRSCSAAEGARVSKSFANGEVSLMSATVIDGKILAESIREGLKLRVAALKAKGVSPCLAVILVGDDAASQSYVNSKEKDCAEIGVMSLDKRF